MLELLLFYAIPQGDVNTVAHALMDRFGSLSGVFDAPLEELKRVPGVGEHTAVLIKMIPSVAGRYVSDRAGRGTIIERTGINKDVGWSRVVYNGETLYCVSSYVKVVSP